MSKMHASTSNPHPLRENEHGTQMSLFSPLSYFMVRAPLFPLEAYLHLDTSHTDFSLTNPLVRLAIGIGSPSLLEEFERSTSSLRDTKRRDQKLLRYLIRMSTRPTPYGLFAGVALGEWGETTDLSISHSLSRIQARPDMNWLMSLIWKLEALPEVRQYLHFTTNTATYMRNDTIYLHERAISAETQIQTGLMPVTASVKRALELARTPTAFSDLVADIISALPDITPQEAEQLITSLWKQTFLLSDLRPPLTATVHPVSYLQHRLAEIPATATLATHLAILQEQIHSFEEASLEDSFAHYHSLTQQIKRFTHMIETTCCEQTLAVSQLPGAVQPSYQGRAKQANDLLQVDMRMKLGGQILSSQIAADVVRLAETMLRLSPLPHGSAKLIPYRTAFLDRYGPLREVPLLELLDENFGLGAPPAMFSISNEEQHHSRRHQILINLALTAQQARSLSVELDERTLSYLQTWEPEPTSAPYSLDLNVSIAAASATDIDSGHYQLIPGPLVGSQQGGSSFGRFVSLIGDSCLEILHSISRALARLVPMKLLVELVYLPYNGRDCNVVICPAVYPYEISYATTPGVAHKQTIPFDELVVVLGLDGRFFLYWPRHNTEILLRSNHILAPHDAPPIIRLLSAIALSEVPILTTFDWGPASHFPFLPRVQMDRLVLSLAQWHLSNGSGAQRLSTSSPEEFHRSLATWRDNWSVPRYVYLSNSDNRLLLDLENPQQREELRLEVRKLQDGASLTLQEVFPTLEQSWVKGPGGHYVTEYIFPLISRTSGSPLNFQIQTGSRVSPTTGERLKAPGNDWLFMKLYLGRELQDDLLAGPVRTFAHNALRKGLAQDWFFLRYTDPDPHLRLRFRGDPRVLIEKLMPLLCEWGTSLMTQGPCLKFSFDTYDREIERYGGYTGMELAETLFGADSRAVVDLLALLAQEHSSVLDRKLLVVLSIDHLLASLGADRSLRLEWYRQKVAARHTSGLVYRQQKSLLRLLLTHPEDFLKSIPAGYKILHVLEQRHAELIPLAKQLSTLQEQGSLCRPITSLFIGYVHMHFNRFHGINSFVEEEVLGLLLRTHEGLERSSNFEDPFFQQD